MNNYLISVIVPVYNVELYIRECLDSIINQELYDIEIIIVNDCSEDSSAVIAEEYAAKDSRIKVIHHDVRKGLGAARNTGIANASGEYLGFVDSDDFIDKRCYKLLYTRAKELNADVVSGQLQAFDDTGKKDVWPNYVKHFNSLFSCDEYMDEIFGLFYVCAWCRIYRRLYFLKYIVCYDESVLYEDVFPYFKCYLNSDRLTAIPDTIYFWRQRSSSLSKRTPSVTSIESYCDNIFHYINNNFSNIDKIFFIKFFVRQFYWYPVDYSLKILFRKKIKEYGINDDDFLSLDSYLLSRAINLSKISICDLFRVVAKKIFSKI